MITEWLQKHIFEWLREYPKYFLPFGLFSAACLFLPDEILFPIGLLEIRDQFKNYLGATFMLSATFILAATLTTIGRVTKKHISDWFYRKRIKRRLARISPEEAKILAS